VPAYDQNEVKAQVKIENTPRRMAGLQFNDPLWFQCVGDREVKMQIGVGAYNGISTTPAELVVFANRRPIARYTLGWEAVVERYRDKWRRLRTNKFSLDELRRLRSQLSGGSGFFEVRYSYHTPRYRARGDKAFGGFIERCSSP
jgi:hypothetical protein